MMTREETWQRLSKLGIVKGEMPDGEETLQRWNLSGTDLCKTNLVGAMLDLADLDAANLQNANLQGATLQSANLEGANLRGADLQGADLLNADFSRANLSNADLSQAKLLSANLYKADISNADLSGADLSEANLSEANLMGANLVATDFTGAALSRANLTRADLTAAQFIGASLTRANLTEASLGEANFMNAFLIEANLTKVNAFGANLSGADLTKANLYKANLSGVRLHRANLNEANLSKANLNGANLSNASLNLANLIGTNINECVVYGISTWDIKTNNKTAMKDLVISRHGQPLMTVDDIEVAQFIYMLLNNEKIAKFINTMRTKTILILGSFDSKSMTVLETLKDTIRGNGYLPLLFDFAAPHTQELMETVKTMALLSSFVVVDLSIRSGQLHELASLVRDTYIPFATIAREGTEVTAMHGEFKHYYWYKDKYFSYTPEKAVEQIPQLFEKEIIPWADKVNEEIKGKRK